MRGYENIVRVLENHIGMQFERNRELYETLGKLENDLREAEQQLAHYKNELTELAREYQKDREKWADLEKNQ
jgi:cell division protein FtsB